MLANVPVKLGTSELRDQECLCWSVIPYNCPTPFSNSQGSSFLHLYVLPLYASTAEFPLLWRVAHCGYPEKVVSARHCKEEEVKKMLAWHRRVRGNRAWRCCSKGVARPSTHVVIIQAMSNCPGYFPRLLLRVVLPRGVGGRSRHSPTSCAGCVGSQGRMESPVQHCVRVLDCTLLLAWVLGQEPWGLTSPPRRAIHTNSSQSQVFALYMKPKPSDSLCCRLLQALSIFQC